MIPFQAIMLPVYIITLKLHLIDSVNNVMGYIGLVMPFAVSAFGIFLMRQAFIKVPKEVEEAAIVDGCNVFQMFTRVVIPMVKPTLAVLAVFTFIGSWGEFLWPSIMLTKMLCTHFRWGLITCRECSLLTGDLLQQVQ